MSFPCAKYTHPTFPKAVIIPASTLNAKSHLPIIHSKTQLSSASRWEFPGALEPVDCSWQPLHQEWWRRAAQHRNTDTGELPKSSPVMSRHLPLWITLDKGQKFLETDFQRSSKISSKDVLSGKQRGKHITAYWLSQFSGAKTVGPLTLLREELKAILWTCDIRVNLFFLCYYFRT